jgi:thioredoxin reductase (NADPH)
MSTPGAREHQMFPVLNATQIATAGRFASGAERRFAPGEIVFTIGERGAPAWLLLDGAIDVTRRDGLGQEARITTHGPGQLTGEINQLAGRPSIAAGRAGPVGCLALPFDPAHLPLWLGRGDFEPCEIGQSIRIGISRDADRLLRFYLRDSPFVSGPRSLKK